MEKLIDYLSKGNKLINKFFGYDFMEDRMKGVLFGVFGLFLWFSPWVSLGEYMGVSAHQTGQHIGGIAYLLLFSSFMYAALSWLEQYRLTLVAAGASTTICCLFTTQAGSSVAWGLILYLISSIASAIFAFRKCKAVPRTETYSC